LRIGTGCLTVLSGLGAGVLIESMQECWMYSLDPDEDCETEREMLEECVEELGDSYEWV